MTTSAVAGVRSLGFRTDLVLLELQGATIRADVGCMIIRTPGEPTFHWGNFLLLQRSPVHGTLDRWVDRFAMEFPAADHVALGVDTANEISIPSEELSRAGLEIGRDIVLTARPVREPVRPNRTAHYRPLDTDADWRAQLDLRFAIDGGTSSQLFLQRRVAAHRQLVQAGHGAWFGAFVNGQLRSSLGIFSVGGGFVRYQNVGTHPEARNQGLAGTLIYEAGRYALTALGATTLVIVADPSYHAIGIYRSAGFTDTEIQVGLEGAGPA